MGDGRQVWILMPKGLDWGSKGPPSRLGTALSIGVRPCARRLASTLSGILIRSGALGRGSCWLCVRITRAGVGPGRRCFSEVFHVLLMCIRPRPVGSVSWFLNLVAGPGGPGRRRPHLSPRVPALLVHSRVRAVRSPSQAGQLRTQRGGASCLGHPAGGWDVHL